MKRNLGCQIRSRRESLGITLKLLASRIGRHYTWLASIERGQLAIGDEIAKKLLSAIDRIKREAVEGVELDFADLRPVDRRRKRVS
jgi:ribosome-binding protein aMBF1 (putative translation factor)